MTTATKTGIESATTASSKNDPAAFGARMNYRLQDLISDPYSFVPSYADRYGMLQQYCKTMTPHQSYAMTMLVGPDAARGYAAIPNTFGLTFPDAHRVDVTEQVGWYYFAGNVRGRNGVEYGVLLMMFQYTLLPPPIAGHFGLSPLENQTLDVQLAITTADGRMHQAAPQFFAGTSGDIEIADRLFVRAGKNVVDTPSHEALYPMVLRAAGEDLGGAAPVRVGIDITLVSGNNILLQGLDGASPCVGGVGTRYYSIPNLLMDAAKSSLTIGDDVVQLDSGVFWFDHQWGTGMIPNGAPTAPVLRAAGNVNSSPGAASGWSFFVANFDDGSALTLSHIHDAGDAPWLHQTGNKPPPEPAVPVSGKFQDRFGTCFNVSGTVEITDWIRGVTSPEPAKYPVSNTWFPFAWTLNMCDTVLPARLLNLRLEPICNDPSAMFFANGAQYCEAPVKYYDASGAMCGRGFCESVGYQDSLATTVGLAGLPADEIKNLQPVTPSLLLKLLSMAYVAMNKKEMAAIIACGSFPQPARPCSCD